MRKSRFITKECIVAMHTHLIHLRKKELSCQGLISQEYVLINARHLLIPDTHVHARAYWLPRPQRYQKRDSTDIFVITELEAKDEDKC